MGMNVGWLTSDKTAKGDECYTPYYAVEPIVKYLDKSKIIWCPFDEEWSAYYQTLKKAGFHVIRSSLKEKKDFFTWQPKKFDIVISNPPFSKKDAVLKRLDQLGCDFALLLPMNSLQGIGRYSNCFKNGIELLAFDKRISFHTNQDMIHFKQGNHFASAYFCRGILPEKLIVEKLEVFEKPLVKSEGD